MYRGTAVAGPANPLVIVAVDQAQGMATALQRAGVPEPLIVLHGHLHAAADASQVWDQTVAFLTHQLGVPKP